MAFDPGWKREQLSGLIQSPVRPRPCALCSLWAAGDFLGQPEQTEGRFLKLPALWNEEGRHWVPATGGDPPHPPAQGPGIEVRPSAP